MITGREIGERFIRAVQIMEGLYYVGPSSGGSSWVPVPYTQADKNGWGSERLADERKAFWNSINNSPRPWEVTEAEETMTWLSYVSDENERKCLTSWARCMATNDVFKEWCAEAGIHEETGRRRKERAILRILLTFNRKPLQHNEMSVEDLLPDTPETAHKHVNIGEDTLNNRRWMAEDAKPICGFDASLQDFSWADKRNEQRRQRRAAMLKKQAA